ncbi:hypothetical protein [Bacillus anthracis]
MSKVNVDEIQVGDLVEIYFEFEGEKSLGYVVDLYIEGIRVFYSDWLREDDVFFTDDNITGHWKVINFEEESKMNDELKVYTGKEALQALLEGKTLESLPHNYQYKMENDKLVTLQEDGAWKETVLGFNVIAKLEFTEVATPQVGDWVMVTHSETKAVIITGEITEIDNLVARIEDRLISLKHDWEILSPEQISEYKRELAFSKVGRKLNEFKPEDIVYVESLEKVMIVISKINTDKVMLREINYTGSGRHAPKPHQLTPISFVENQVDLS